MKAKKSRLDRIEQTKITSLKLTPTLSQPVTQKALPYI